MFEILLCSQLVRSEFKWCVLVSKLCEVMSTMGKVDKEATDTNGSNEGPNIGEILVRTLVNDLVNPCWIW